MPLSLTFHSQYDRERPRHGRSACTPALLIPLASITFSHSHGNGSARLDKGHPHGTLKVSSAPATSLLRVPLFILGLIAHLSSLLVIKSLFLSTLQRLFLNAIKRVLGLLTLFVVLVALRVLQPLEEFTALYCSFRSFAICSSVSLLPTSTLV